MCRNKLSKCNDFVAIEIDNLKMYNILWIEASNTYVSLKDSSIVT